MFGVCLTWPLIPMICEYREHLPQFCSLLDRHQTFVKVGLSNVVVCKHTSLAILVSIISKIANDTTLIFLIDLTLQTVIYTEGGTNMASKVVRDR
jgi:hypothetical protein